jgi:hypothetical protein
MPAVVHPLETKIPGIAPQAPGMRAEAVLSPDRRKVTINMNPAFGGKATDLHYQRSPCSLGRTGSRKVNRCKPAVRRACLGRTAFVFPEFSISPVLILSSPGVNAKEASHKRLGSASDKD